jgi:hypothetical protein
MSYVLYMTLPQVPNILHLFLNAAPKSVFEAICERRKLRFGSGIYNMAVVTWLMILQRLQPHQTLNAAVLGLCQGQADHLLGDCKRVREGRISPPCGRFLPSPTGTAG